MDFTVRQTFTRAMGGAMLLAWGVVALSCSQLPNSPDNISSSGGAAHLGHVATADTTNPNAAAKEKGYIDGWFNGDSVQLYYTKWFFCDEPPDSLADTDCEIGAPAEVAPRPGPIPAIYAIAAAGIQPDPDTLACMLGSPCLNHPAMIDISRIRPGATVSPALSHSHILRERRAGWFHTVNIRVSDLTLWNQIAAAKSLDKVRQLQADPANAGRISADTPTNLDFFIASWR
jgi:hypothetical protein